MCPWPTQSQPSTLIKSLMFSTVGRLTLLQLSMWCFGVGWDLGMTSDFLNIKNFKVKENDVRYEESAGNSVVSMLDGQCTAYRSICRRRGRGIPHPGNSRDERNHLGRPGRAGEGHYYPRCGSTWPERWQKGCSYW